MEVMVLESGSPVVNGHDDVGGLSRERGEIILKCNDGLNKNLRLHYNKLREVEMTRRGVNFWDHRVLFLF